MTWPLQFPDPQEEARRRAADFQSRSSDDRWQEMAALMAFGYSLLRSSPDREKIEQQMKEDENQSRRAIEKLIAEHAS